MAHSAPVRKTLRPRHRAGRVRFLFTETLQTTGTNQCRVSVATYPANAASLTPRGAFRHADDCRSQLGFDRSRQVTPGAASIIQTPSILFRPRMVESLGTAPRSDDLAIEGSAPSFVVAYETELPICHDFDVSHCVTLEHFRNNRGHGIARPFLSAGKAKFGVAL